MLVALPAGLAVFEPAFDGAAFEGAAFDGAAFDGAAFEGAAFEGAALFALLAVLFAIGASPPQAIPNAPKARSVESAIIFFI